MMNRTNTRLTAVLLALALCLSLLTGCGSKKQSGTAQAPTPAASSAQSAGQVPEESAPAAVSAGEWGSALDWDAYDELISRIRTTADTAQRAELMHEAEDMLMDTWCILPVYYMNNTYLIKDYVSGVSITPAGTKYFSRVKMSDERETMNIFMADEPESLDPAMASSVADMSLAANCFEGLMTYDESGRLQCAAAESYQVSRDGLDYTFTLREGLKWSNGADLTVDDFVYAWRRAADVKNGSGYAYLFDVFSDGQHDPEGNLICMGDGAVEVDRGKRTITAHLKAVCPYFLDLCAFPTFFPVYEHSCVTTATEGLPTGTWASDPGERFVCNGPYTLTAWNHDADLTLTKNEAYWDAERVSVSTLNFMLTSDNAAAFAAYQVGDLDFVSEIATDEMDALLAAQSPELHTVPALGTYFVACCYKAPFYQELGLTEEQAKVFRHALCLLIDRQNIIDSVGKAGQHPATSFIPEGCSNGNGRTFESREYFSVEDYNANVDEAMALLESIGLWDGTQLTREVRFSILTNDTESSLKLCELLQQDWGQLGMDVSIQKEETGTYFADRKAGSFDVCRANWLMDYNDPINMLEIWASSSSNNYVYLGR